MGKDTATPFFYLNPGDTFRVVHARFKDRVFTKTKRRWVCNVDETAELVNAVHEDMGWWFDSWVWVEVVTKAEPML